MKKKNDPLQQYRDTLKEDNEDTRVEVYREIGALGIPEGNTILLEGLSDSSHMVRSVVAEILIENVDEKLVERLLELLREENPGLRSQAMTILSKLGILALKQVETYLKDNDRDVRIFAANILGTTGLREAFPALVEAIHDPEENVRYAIVEALGKIGEKKSIPLLLDILKDEWARYPAVEALGLLKAQEAIPYLLKIYEEDEWVRLVVIEAIGNTGDTAQIDFLINALYTDNEMILHAALAALAKIEQITPCSAFERVKEKGIDADAIIHSALKVHEPGIRKSAIWTLVS